MKNNLSKVAAPIFEALRSQDSISRTICLVDQAKLVRAALADTFPSTKFSVRSESYSGGCAIRIHWVDGPTTEAVDEIANRYEGGGFDGTIDLAYSKKHWFAPDGTVSLAHDEGTIGSRGCHREHIGSAHHPSALWVDFSAHYVTTSRSHSIAARQNALRRLAASYCPVLELPAVPLYERKTSGKYEWFDLSSDPLLRSGEYLSCAIRQVLEGKLLSEVDAL